MSETITIETMSPGLDAEAIEIVVTIPTFRRPQHLVETLRTIADQRTARRVAVVVMENDAEDREGLRAARPLFHAGTIAGLILVAHERGNCAAYNAGWTTALSTFPAMRHLLVIDDDELASPNWIEELVDCAGRLDVDLVGGPVLPVFDGASAGGLARHPVFQPPYDEDGRVPVLYGSGNVLIGRQVLERMPRPYLDRAFDFIGGGDADFFERCRGAGFKAAWTNAALIHETTPLRRTEFSWLQARGMREGALSAIVARRAAKSRRERWGVLLKSAALLSVSPFRALALALRTRSVLIGLYPINVGIGRLLGEFGIVHEQYRSPEKN